MAVPRTEAAEPKLGILTKTVVRSPVVRWILHAQIRQRRFNDVVFVGDDFIHVKQIIAPGHLEHVATKSDFDTRIRGAKTFSNETHAPDEELFFKLEHDEASKEDAIPPQCVVLALDTNDLLFLCLVPDDNGRYQFIHQACPMPTFDRTIYQPGEHLAVDPHSRALAVAANEQEVVIYTAKSTDRIKTELQARDRNWCPISAQRPLQVDGVIQHMDFMIPPSDDEDHILLLLILVDQQRTRAVWIDWHLSSDLHEAHIHPSQPLDNTPGVSNLLVPLRNATFFLIKGTEVRRWSNLLSGSLTVEDPQLTDTEPSHPGASPRHPVWVNWCRPIRSASARDDVDDIYLVREDGIVYLVRAGGDIYSSHAGQFGCHVGSAFASLGDTRSPDILAVAGDMSSGRIHSIGSWFTPLQLSERSRLDAMEMELIETIPNWASVTDMITSSLPGRSQRSRDAIFVTSCRQPYGSVTELRQGLEARLLVYFELEGLKSVTDVWALPLVAVGHILLVLSSPAGTRLLKVSADAEMENIEEIEEDNVALDAVHQTLAAAAIADGRLVQITTKSICVSAGVSANFEDAAKIDSNDSTSIVAAAIDAKRSFVVTAERSRDYNTGYVLVQYAIRTADEIASGEAHIYRQTTFELDSEPLCVESLNYDVSNSVILVSNANGRLNAFATDQSGINSHLLEKDLSSSTPSLCDSMAVITPSSNNHSQNLVVCGLRDGKLYTASISNDDGFTFEDERFMNFGQSPVKLVQPRGDRSISYALSGSDTCLLSRDGGNATSLRIQSIWTSDKNRPELSQGSVIACTHMPAADVLSSPDLAESLVMISGDECQVTTLDRKACPVPRQIPVSGTPNRLLYAEQQRCLVCASLKYEVRSFPSGSPHSKPEERRQICPVIDFMPSKDSEASFSYEMQPGERVYALLEWSFKLGEDKTYSFVLVGGSYVKSSGSTRGRITFLQPINKNWAVTDVKEGRTMNFEAPVYALALLDEVTFIACIGQTVQMYRFSVEERKWEQVCAPFKLASIGIAVSTGPMGNAFVSTAEDSLVVLEFRKSTDIGDDDSDFPHQLVPASVGPRAETLLTHCPLRPLKDIESIPTALMLTSTKYGQLIAMRMRSLDIPYHGPGSSELLCEAQLPRSLTRVKQCKVRPRWKPKSPAGVFHDNVLGCAADGTLMGILTLDRPLWHRLSWLQRLCEWSEEISPHMYQSPPYGVSEQTYARNEIGMPIGLARGSTSEIVMKTSRSKLQDGHIDGDILVRILQKGGAETLKKLIRETADRDDRAGEWVRAHMDAELNAVDEVVDILRRLLDSWI